MISPGKYNNRREELNQLHQSHAKRKGMRTRARTMETVDEKPASSTSPLRAAMNAGPDELIGAKAVIATAFRTSYENDVKWKNRKAITVASRILRILTERTSLIFDLSRLNSSIRPIIIIARGPLAGLIIPAKSKTASGRDRERAARMSIST